MDIGENYSTIPAIDTWKSRRSHRKTSTGSRQRDDDALVIRLRGEANDAKDCFTRYAFQTLAISLAALGIILRVVQTDPLLGLAGISVLLLAMGTCRAGTYKYGLANRHIGYELHLSRMKTIGRVTGRPNVAQDLEIGWEEAMRAWRVVQATLFETIHERASELKPDQYRSGYRPSGSNPKWYSQHSLFGNYSDARWYPGSYLKTMMTFLHSVALAGVLAVIYAPVGLFIGELGNIKSLTWDSFLAQTKIINVSTLWFDIQLIVCLAVANVSVFYFVRKRKCNLSRLEILEDGLLSIHACAIVWQAVVIGHQRSIELATKYNMSSMILAAKVNERIIADLAKGLEKSSPRPSDSLKTAQAIFDDEKRFNRTLVGSSNNQNFSEVHATVTQLREGNAVVFLNLQPATATLDATGEAITGYSFWLGQTARSVAMHAADIQKWISEVSS